MGYNTGQTRDVTPWSIGSMLSIGSVGAILSIGSVGSILSIGSTGSILSIGSAGSIASIGSSGSIASIGAAGSIGSFGGTGELGEWRRAAPLAVVALVVSGSAAMWTMRALRSRRSAPESGRSALQHSTTWGSPTNCST